MSEDNGFVERPDTGVSYRSEVVRRLIQTSENGKAIIVNRRSTAMNHANSLRNRGYQVRTRTREGAIYAWAEKIEAPK